MKKRLMLLFLFTTIALSSLSQWGFKVGVTYGELGMLGVTDPSFKLGGYVDGVYDLKIYKNFYFQPGAGLYLNNTTFVFHGADDSYTRIFGAEIPLNLSLRPSISKNIGLFVDLGFVGRMRLISANSEKLPSEYVELLRFAGAFNIGAGIQIEKRYMIGLAYQGQPLIKDSSNTDWYRTFGLTFAYKF